MNCKCGGVCAFCQQAALEKENPSDRQRREARENRDKHFIDPHDIDALRAAAKEHGMVLVPEEPTEAMVDAFCEVFDNLGDDGSTIDLDVAIPLLYKAMVAAAGEGE